MARPLRRKLLDMYDALYRAYGPQHWWPGDGPTEIIIGAILTQNTNWSNVTRAIANLKSERLLDWRRLRDVSERRLARAIRPAGYFNVKARRIKRFVRWLWDEFDGRPEKLRRLPLEELRPRLRSVHGIGPETADSILLYALGKTTFVVDAYTARLARRHGISECRDGYEGLKAVFEGNLPRDARRFNEYHALIVAVGKRHCRTRAKCEGYPLAGFEHDAEA